MRFRLRAPSLVLLLVAGIQQAQAVGLPGPAFPGYSSAAQLKLQCDDGLKRAQAELARLEKLAPDEHWLAAYDDFNALVDDASGAITFVSSVHPEAAIRAASEDCNLRWQDFFSSTGQNAKLYAASKVAPAVDEIDREALRLLREGFEDSGVGLPPVQRARAKQLVDRIGRLSQEFEKAVREDRTRLAFSEADLAGVSADVLKAAKRDAQGRYLLGLDYPTFFPVMDQAEREQTRERMWRAKYSVGGAANLRRLGEVVRLRKELAALFGFRSYAEFATRRSMAGSAERVNRFLDEVKLAVAEGERKDLAEFRAAKAKHLGLALDKTTLQRWDVAFYSERVRRERFDIDEATFRPYFPPQESLQFVMRLAETLFGVRYTRVDTPLWHPEAQAYAVTDSTSGRPLAGLIVDLYPREGKYGHAAVAAYRSGSVRQGRVPQATLMVNFDRKGLTLNELQTLLHEFGHSLHSNLSTTRYSMQSGTNTQRDFVEAPSQMLEDWVYDPQTLALFKEVCPSCKPVPDDLVKKAREARHFAKGSLTARQHLYASYDMALHAADAPDPGVLWARMEGATPLGYVKGSMLPASFGHLVGGYAAGYYGYLWSDVVALDLRTAFDGARLDPQVGRRYRDSVLAHGGELPPGQLVRDFLGRETNSKAFFDDLLH